jgi:TRAP-type C4-dicarboxylate transport system permease small subunit
VKELADRLPPKLGRIVKVAVKTKLNICAIATLILPITFFFVVIFRYGLNADLFAYEEWLLPISFWLYFLASAVGSYEGSQIRADVMESFFKTPRSMWWRRVILNCLELSIGLVLVYWAWLMIDNEISRFPNWQTTIALDIPYFVPRFGIFLGLAFMAFYEMLHLYVLLKFGPTLIEEELACKEAALTAQALETE